MSRRTSGGMGRPGGDSGAPTPPPPPRPVEPLLIDTGDDDLLGEDRGPPGFLVGEASDSFALPKLPRLVFSYRRRREKKREGGNQ